MKRGLLVLICISAAFAGADHPLLWRDPGPVEKLDLAAGPGGKSAAPKPPFTFVEEERRGISPKVVVTDAQGTKWMVKFGDEAKAETFASRIAWAAGYVVRDSYYIPSGQISGANSLKRAREAIDANGTFHDARFQRFDTDAFHAVPDGKLDLTDKSFDLHQLNGLKLTLLLVANWDVKPANTAIFEVGGRRYATIADWGASLGDPAGSNPPDRKWNCATYGRVNDTLIDGVGNGYVTFNYQQYAGKNIDEISQGIRVEDVKWFMTRMGRLTDQQLRAGLLASGASPEDAQCFTSAIRKRLNLFAAAASGNIPGAVETHTRTTTTTIQRTKKVEGK